VREATYRAVEAAGSRGADIGCGAGRAVADLVRLGKEAVGVDSSQAMVDAALARFPHCHVVRGSAFELPFEDAELDRPGKVGGRISWFFRLLRRCRRRPGGTSPRTRPEE